LDLGMNKSGFVRTLPSGRLTNQPTENCRNEQVGGMRVMQVQRKKN
jgi:hypothetical protein